jgi:hypothetical protein
MHMSEICCLDGVVSIEGVRDPVFSITFHLLYVDAGFLVLG